MRRESEIRNPKSEGSPKPEIRNGGRLAFRNSSFGFASDLGFRHSGLLSVRPRCRAGQTSILLLVILGTFLILGALAWYVQVKTRPAPVNQARIQERKRFLAEMRAADTEALSTYGWVDQTKGLVRLPIQRALDLVLEEWKDPAAAHSNMAARAEKAYAPPPAPPAEPNPFE